MDSPFVSVGLPVALAVIMFGLGLSLTVADFARVAKNPRAVTIALACQLLALPAAAFGLVLLFDLPPVLAVGMMLLAASPGGTTANLYSHLFRGDVALNVSLTAVNSVIAVVTLPLVTNFAIGYFDPAGDAGTVGLQFGKAVQVFAIVLVPVALGMVVRRLAPGFADRMDRPVRIGSALMLVLVVLGTMLAERDNLLDYLIDVGPVTVLFCLVSLSVGYFVPRRLGVDARQSIACSMEIGIHNSTIAITIAISVLDSTEMAVPAAVYGVLMFPLAAIFGWLITRKHARAAVPAAG
ncbi:bile acid:sodium symporter family protein [Nocardia puris]|uniref:BASS family bile acid:Na+ symporter n=1 Tax=Nocardia puris TaxID=208602 RepID=A0A366DWF5_9NOCA|nr:bile acid:sodium symporter family protein [Nocardia puris]MBF6209879.1 bile acid:sodium symporter family protein [Nocardia puris]MBF6366451.1 bile acid:sodium symporter family protein [Nocardia puris]MBF6458210.1 bile acid:sodium symporter family protein [Nocardia puris]RBO94382.1 BASS family bile acid:Na+ symporter [Nocardia puris]